MSNFVSIFGVIIMLNEVRYICVCIELMLLVVDEVVVVDFFSIDEILVIC